MFLVNEFGHVRPRQGTEICNFGVPSPLEALHWIFFSSIHVQFSKTSPLESGESSEKSSGENRVKSCHVCGCHGFFGPEFCACFEGCFLRGKFFYLQLEFFCLQLSFFAYSPLLDALSHCKQKAPTVSKEAKTASKKAPTVSKKAKIVNCK